MAPAHPHRGGRRRGHECDRERPGGDGAHRLRERPEGLGQPDRLRASGIDVHVGHDAALVDAADLVAVSTAIPSRNPEVVAANERGVPVARRAEILGAIASTRRCIAVSGTHGKTTTSSMLALVLVEAGLNPSFIIGGELNEIGGGAVWDDGDWFVVEADESDGTFVRCPPSTSS